MIKHTLTTIGDLQPGDKFCKESNPVKFIKVPGEPLRKNKELFECFAVPVKAVIPVPFKKNTPVIFLGKTKKIVI